MRARSLHVQGRTFSEPRAHARTRRAGCPEGAPPGVCFFGDFLCTSTAPQERREQRSWRQRRGGQDARSQESYPLARRASGSFALLLLPGQCDVELAINATLWLKERH